MDRENRNCLVQADTLRISALSGDLVKTLRRLRRDVRRCDQCSGVDDCPVLKGFTSQVQEAIQGVLDEWEHERAVERG